MNQDTIDFLQEQRAKRHASSEALSTDKFIEQLEDNLRKLIEDRDKLQHQIDDTSARLGMMKKTVMAEEDRLRIQKEAKQALLMKEDMGHVLWMVETVIKEVGGSATATQLSMGLKRKFNIDIPASGISSRLLTRLEDDNRFKVVRRDSRNYLYQTWNYVNTK